MLNYLYVLVAFFAITISVYFSKISQFVANQGGLNRQIAQSKANSNAFNLARAEYIAIMRQYGLNSLQLRDGLQKALAADPAAPAWAVTLKTAHTPAGAQNILTVATTAISPSDAGTNYTEVTVTNTGTHTSVVSTTKTSHARLRTGQNGVFRNALTGNGFYCTMCHVHVYGDVGEYYPHGESSGSDASDNRVHGIWRSGGTFNFTAPTKVTDDCSVTTSNAYYQLPCFNQNAIPDFFGAPAFPLPPTTITGRLYVKDTVANFKGPQLPWNFQSQTHSLPKFDPMSMLILARGTMTGTGSAISVVPFGRSTAPVTTTSLSKIVEGNAILNGNAGTLNISGNIFVTGDVVILGPISGKGAVYAGRNVYIADNLTYTTEPSQFDGSASSNATMDQVSTNMTTLAGTMAGDRLALFAANNIVVGDPFVDQINPASLLHPPMPVVSNQYLQPASAVYAGKIVLESYAGAANPNRLGLDMNTGYILENDPLGFRYPWSKKGYVVPSAQSMYLNLNAYENPSDAPSDEAWNLDVNHYTTLGPTKNIFPAPTVGCDILSSDACSGSFYPLTIFPKNIYNSNVVAWISQTTYRSLVNNTTNQANMRAQGYFPGRNYIKYFSVPLFKKFPYTVSNWAVDDVTNESSSTTEGALKTLDVYSGFLGQAGTLPANSGTLKSELIAFLNKCKTAMVGTGAANLPVTNLGSVTRSSYTWVPFKANGVIQTAPDGSNDAMIQVACLFEFNQGISKAWGEIAYYGGAGGVSYSCSDSPTSPALYVAYDTPTAPACIQPVATVWDRRSTATADFRLNVYLGTVRPKTATNPGPTLHSYFQTRYWDPNNVTNRNEVTHIDAYLFANHFLMYPSDTLNSGTLRLHGGIVGKDFAARPMAMADYRVPVVTQFEYADDSQPKGFNLTSSGLPYLANPTLTNGYANQLPSLILMLDPRIQQTTDLLYQDFGTVEMNY